MKKKIGVIFACMLAAAMVALTGCGSGDTTVTTAEFSAEEAAVANAITDVSARFAMPADSVATIRLRTYHKGVQQSESEVRNIISQEDNSALYVSAVNGSGLDYTWTITVPGGRMTYPTPYYDVENGQSMIRIMDVGETEFDLNDGKEHMLYYIAYKSGDDSSTISEKPFHEWSNQTDKEAILKQYDCVYTVTIFQQTAEEAAE